jgi:orotate phosphoribosyltransferase-like protein
MPLYNDPVLIKKAQKLERRGLTRADIAADLGVSIKTVRKMLDPAFAESERERLRAVDEARAPRWDNDQNYQDYQRAYGKKPERLAQVRATMQKRRAT